MPRGQSSSASLKGHTVDHPGHKVVYQGITGVGAIFPGVVLDEEAERDERIGEYENEIMEDECHVLVALEEILTGLCEDEGGNQGEGHDWHKEPHAAPHDVLVKGS